jgi:cysteinyl-tRNA synthetase
MTALRLALGALVGGLIALAASGDADRGGLVRFFNASPLTAVRSWDYWLHSYDLERLAASPADMLVIDYSRSGPSGDAMIPFPRAEIDRLKRGPNGRRRLVIAYLSIGEAEEYRYYWKREWMAQQPSWYIGENCRWPRNHLVKFWEQGWKDLIYAAPKSYLARIQDAGFDGIYVDRIDVYSDLRERFPDGRSQMIAFMREMSAAAKARDPGFLVIAQNAEDLVSDAAYRRAIDGLAKEDLLHGVDATGKRNSAELISWSLGQIQKLQRDGKPALAVEYLRDAEQVRKTRAELGSLGIVPVFPTRALDGRDPFVPDPPAQTPAFGTPEYGAAKCNGVFHKG